MAYVIEDSDKCSISNNASIGEGTIIKIGSIIEDNSVIGNNCIIGPYAHIHSATVIGDNCVIGNFVEIKHSSLANNVKVKHLAYLGDLECGSNVNIGCGVVIANYDGVNKHKTIIKDNVFVGCNSNLIAPLIVGSNAFIAAGSSVNEDVLDNEFVIERSNEIHKKRK